MDLTLHCAITRAMDPKKFNQKISGNMKLDLLLTKSNMDQKVREVKSNELRDKRKRFDKLSNSCNITKKKSTEIDEADLRRAVINLKLGKESP